MICLIFTGSRGWQDRSIIIDCIETTPLPFYAIVGDADGFDSLVWEVLGEYRVPRMKFNGRWEVSRRGGGHIRNDIMLSWGEHLRSLGMRVSVIAGWDGKSPGTKGMMDKAVAKGFFVWRMSYYPNLNGVGN